MVFQRPPLGHHVLGMLSALRFAFCLLVAVGSTKQKARITKRKSDRCRTKVCNRPSGSNLNSEVQMVRVAHAPLKHAPHPPISMLGDFVSRGCKLVSRKCPHKGATRIRTNIEIGGAGGTLRSHTDEVRALNSCKL